MEIMEIVAVLALITAVVGWLKVGKLQKSVKQTETEMESLRSHVTASGNILKREIADVLNNLERRVKTNSDHDESEEEGFHADEITRGVVGFLANVVFEMTPSSLVITAFSGPNEEPTDHKVYTGLHTP